MNFVLSIYNTNNVAGKFLKHFLTLFSANLSGQLVIILSSPVLSRLYSPADFGILEIILSIFTIIAVTVNWKFENAIVVQKSSNEADKVLFLCLIINFFMLFIGLFFCFFLQYIQVISISSVLTKWWWAPPFLGWFVGMQQALQMYFLRQKKYFIISMLLFMQSIALVGLQIIYGYLFEYNSSSLVAAYLINSLFVCVLFFIFFFRDNTLNLSIYRPSLYYKVLECKYFLIYTLPTSFLGAVAQRGLFLVLGIFFAETDIGFASLAMRVMFFPISMISRSMSQIFFGTFSEEIGKKDFSVQINKILRFQIISISFIIPIIVNAPKLFVFCFGPQWMEAGYYAMLLSPAAFMLYLTAWLDRTHDVASRQGKALSLELTYDVCLLIGMLSVSYLFNSPTYLLAFFGFFTATYNIFWLFSTAKIIGITFRSSFLNILLLSSCVIIGFVLYFLIEMLSPNTLLTVISFYALYFSLFFSIKRSIDNENT